MSDSRVLERIQFRGCEYQLRRIFCNKLKCTKCPHGPYWYCIVKMPVGPPVVRYCGKKLTGAILDYVEGRIND